MSDEGEEKVEAFDFVDCGEKEEEVMVQVKMEEKEEEEEMDYDKNYSERKRIKIEEEEADSDMFDPNLMCQGSEPAPSSFVAAVAAAGDIVLPLFQCQKCGYFALNKIMLQEHIMREHVSRSSTENRKMATKDWSTATPIMAVLRPMLPSSFPCDQCDHLAPNKIMLEVHIKRDHQLLSTMTVGKHKIVFAARPSSSVTTLPLSPVVPEAAKPSLPSFPCNYSAASNIKLQADKKRDHEQKKSAAIIARRRCRGEQRIPELPMSTDNLLRQLDADKNEEELETWLQDLGLLHSVRQCPRCGADMLHSNGRVWRCCRRDCRKDIGFLKGTFFEDSHLSYKEVLRISYYWATDSLKFADFQQAMKRPDGSTPSTSTVLKRLKQFRQICSDHFVANTVKLGGVDKVVEIQEGPLVENRRRDRGGKDQWLLVLAEREEQQQQQQQLQQQQQQQHQHGGNCYLLALEEKWSEEKLLEVVTKHVLPGTTVASSDLPLPEEHCDLSFRSGDTTRNSNLVLEAFRAEIKARQGITSYAFLPFYVSSFLWKRKFAGQDLVECLWSEIATAFPVER